MREGRTFIPAEPVDGVYTAMRVIIGFLFLSHGAQKLFGIWGGHQVALDSRLGAAGIIETTAGALIILGLFTTAAALVASLEMIVAYSLAHAPQGSHPIQNGGELAVAYCVIFLYIATQGDGRWSLAAILRSPAARIGSRTRIPG